MKKEFSTSWSSSSQPRKQRKYLANAPLHLKRKQLSVNLSKDLRVKQGTRNVILRKGDTVKIMRGKFRGYIEGIQATKQDGSKVNVPIRASNLQVIELIMDDKKRLKNTKITKTETPKKEKKEIIKEKKK